MKQHTLETSFFCTGTWLIYYLLKLVLFLFIIIYFEWQEDTIRSGIKATSINMVYHLLFPLHPQLESKLINWSIRKRNVK